MRDQWNKSGKYQFFSIIIVYSVVFCFSIIYESHQKPTFSAQQIADYGYGIVVAITDPNSNQNEGPVFHTNGIDFSVNFELDPSKTHTTRVFRTGFWVTTNGCVCTCGIENPKEGLVVGIASPLKPKESGPLVRIYSSSVVYNGVLTGYVRSDNTCFFYAPSNPFERKDHISTEVSSGMTIEHIELENYKVPIFGTTTNLSIGDALYFMGCDSEGDGAITVRLIKTAIESMSHELIGGEWRSRIKTSAQYEASYVGAPVFNDSKELVGIVGDDTNGITIIPSESILSALPLTTKIIIK